MAVSFGNPSISVTSLNYVLFACWLTDGSGVERLLKAVFGVVAALITYTLLHLNPQSLWRWTKISLRGFAKMLRRSFKNDMPPWRGFRHRTAILVSWGPLSRLHPFAPKYSGAMIMTRNHPFPCMFHWNTRTLPTRCERRYRESFKRLKRRIRMHIRTTRPHASVRPNYSSTSSLTYPNVNPCKRLL